MTDAIPAFVRNGLPPAREPSDSHDAKRAQHTRPALAVVPKPIPRIDPKQPVKASALSTPLHPNPAADPEQLLFIDAYLDDPILKAVAQQYGDASVNLEHPAAQSLAAHYGGDRALALLRASSGMQKVRSAFYQALHDPAQWPDTAAQALWRDRVAAGQADWNSRYQAPGKAYAPPPPPEPDLPAFLDQYCKQNSLLAQAFEHLYGRQAVPVDRYLLGFTAGSPTTVPTWRLGSLTVTAPGESWGDSGPTSLPKKVGWDVHLPAELMPLNAGKLPELNNNDFGAVWFDPSLGLVSPTANFKTHGPNWFEKAFPAIVMIVMAVVTGGAASAAATQAGATNTAATVAGGAAAGGTVAFMNGLMNDSLSLKDVLRGIFTGAVTAYVSQAMNLNGRGVSQVKDAQGQVLATQVTDWSQRILAVGGKALLQGTLQSVTGGQFKEGVIAALGTAAGEQLSMSVENTLYEQVRAGELHPMVASQLSFLARGFGNGLGSAAGGGDGLTGFLSGLTQETLKPPAPTKPAPADPAERNTAWFQDPVQTSSPTLNAEYVDGQLKLADFGFDQTVEAPLNDLPLIEGRPFDLMAYLEFSNGLQLENAQTDPLIVAYGSERARIREELYLIDLKTQEYARRYPTLSESDLRQSIAEGRGTSDLLKYRDDPAFQSYAGSGVQTVASDTPQPDRLVLTDFHANESPAMLSSTAALAPAIAPMLPAIGDLLKNLVPVVLGAAEAVTGVLLLATPSNIFQSSQVFTPMGENERFAARPGERHGQLQRKNPEGDWETVKGNVSLYGSSGRFVALTDEEYRRLHAPHQHPEAQALPAIPAHRSDDERLNLPGYSNNAPNLPTREEYPALDPLTVDDLIIERNSSEQRRFRNLLIDDARGINPNFDPTGYEAHHIIPINEYPQLNWLRERLAVWGIDINAPANGVLLPATPAAGEGNLHSDTQRSFEYQQAIERRFRLVESRQEALDTFQRIRNELREGRFVAPRKTQP